MQLFTIRKKPTATELSAIKFFMLILIAISLLCADLIYADLESQPAALYYTGNYDLNQLDPNLTGSGVTIGAVCRSLTYIDRQPQDDYLLNIDHSCFNESNIRFIHGFNEGQGLSDHSTAIGAILVGNDPNAYHEQLGKFSYRGVCTDASLNVYEFWRFVSSNIYGNQKNNCDILTLSVGEVFPDWWTRGIESLSENDGTIVIAAIGNGQNVYDPLLYPAAGANIIGVGVIDSTTYEESLITDVDFSLPHKSHSSSGPTADGRSKPDIVAPGNFLVPVVDDNAFYEMSGDFSSFAAPVVAGTSALLIQKAKDTPELEAAATPKGKNCLIKAVLLNSATKLPYWHKGTASKDDNHTVPLDFTQGAGALNAKRAYEQLIAGRGKPGTVKHIGWDNNIIIRHPAAARKYRLTAAENAKYITITLTWNKHYSNEYPFESLDKLNNNLQLQLWAIDHDDPENNKLLDYSDSPIDNIEHIYCPVDPDYSEYEIVVTFADEDESHLNQIERYGLAWNTTGPDSTDNRWWYDLNNDGLIDGLDNVTFYVFESMPQITELVKTELKLSEDRISLLRQNWQNWKHFLPDWITPE